MVEGEGSGEWRGATASGMVSSSSCPSRMGVGGNRVGRIVGVGVGGVCGCGGCRVFGLCGHKRRDLDDVRVSVSLRRIRGCL